MSCDDSNYSESMVYIAIKYNGFYLKADTVQKVFCPMSAIIKILGLFLMSQMSCQVICFRASLP